MAQFTILVFVLARGLDAKEAKTEMLTGDSPVDISIQPNGPTAEQAPFDEKKSGMRDEERDAAEKQMEAASPGEGVGIREAKPSLVQTKVSGMGESKAAPAAQASQEVPYYFFNFPLSVKFVELSDTVTQIALMDMFTIPLELPKAVQYVYPLVFFLMYTLVWCMCCRRSNRTGLSFRLVVEAATCFMCLWADLATKHKVISSSRAWSYVVLMVILLSGWNIAEMVTAKDESAKNVVFFLFQTMVGLVWCMYSIERMFVRKFYRRSADPMAADHSMADCVASACCGQFTALQEAQLMSSVQGQDTQASHKTHW